MLLSQFVVAPRENILEVWLLGSRSLSHYYVARFVLRGERSSLFSGSMIIDLM